MNKSAMPAIYHIFSNFTREYFLKSVAKKMLESLPSRKFKSLK